jgi:hypothetical protein
MGNGVEGGGGEGVKGVSGKLTTGQTITTIKNQ